MALRSSASCSSSCSSRATRVKGSARTSKSGNRTSAAAKDTPRRHEARKRKRFSPCLGTPRGRGQEAQKSSSCLRAFVVAFEVAMTTTTVMRKQLFINGEWRDATGGKTIEVVNPATEEVIAEVASADKSDVDAAVAAARAALDGPWGKLSARERGKLVWKIGEKLMERADEIARLETLHNGKPIFESRQIEVPAAAECFQYYAGWADKIHGETVPVKGNYLTYTLREPVGVVAAIVPWNFPLLLTAWKVAPALACGNTVIIKPASQTPLTALALAEIA